MVFSSTERCLTISFASSTYVVLWANNSDFLNHTSLCQLTFPNLGQKAKKWLAVGSLKCMIMPRWEAYRVGKTRKPQKSKKKWIFTNLVHTSLCQVTAVYRWVANYFFFGYMSKGFTNESRARQLLKKKNQWRFLWPTRYRNYVLCKTVPFKPRRMLAYDEMSRTMLNEMSMIFADLPLSPRTNRDQWTSQQCEAYPSCLKMVHDMRYRATLLWNWVPIWGYSTWC